MGKYSFEQDLAVAKKTEREVADRIRRTFGRDLKPEFCNDNSHDIRVLFADEDGSKYFTFEVKEDFMTMNTGNVFVEFECRGKPSGIATSKAHFYIYKIHLSPVKHEYRYISTKALRQTIGHGTFHHRVCEGAGDPGSNTKGYLFRYDVFKGFTTEM